MGVLLRLMEVESYLVVEEEEVILFQPLVALLGGIKVGTGLSIDSSTGVLSAGTAVQAL